MQVPSKWLIYGLIVHGLIGSFGEVLDSILNKMAVPLGSFFKDSMSIHYGIELSTEGIQTILSLMGNLKLLGSICSVVFILPKMDSWGRKPLAVYLRTALSALAAAFMIVSKFANSFELFACAVLLMGGAFPLRTGVNKLYLAECSPDGLRGFATQSIATLSQVMLLASAVLMLPATFGNDTFWYLVPAFVLTMAVIYIALAIPLPESPKFLTICGETKAASNAIKKFQGEDVDLEDVLRQYDLEFQTTASSHTSFRDLWADSTLRDSLYLVFITSLVPYFGIPQIFYLYGISLKIRYGFTNEQALMLDLILSFVFIPVFLVLPYLYERIGRRPIFLFTNVLSLAGSATVLFAQVVYRFTGASIFTIALGGIFSFIFMLVSSLGASIFYVILIADLLPASAKATTTQAAVLASSISAIFANLGYATLEPWLGSGVFAPFVIVQLLFVIYCWRNLPETRQKAVYQNYAEMRSRSASFAPIFSKSRNATLSYGSVNTQSLRKAAQIARNRMGLA